MKKINQKTIIMVLALCTAFITYGQEFTKKNTNLSELKSKNFGEAPKKVFVKNFKIFYQMIAEAETTNRGGYQMGGNIKGDATARMAVGVDGIEPDQLQALTNSLYEGYISKLKSMGFEVLTSSDIPSIDSFDGWEMIEGPRMSEEQVRGSLMVVPDDFSYYVKGVKKSGKEKTGAFMSGITGDDAGFASAIYGPVAKISKELDDMVVVEVVLNVPSIWLVAKRTLGGAKAEGGPNLRLESSRITYASGKVNKPGVAYPAVALEFTQTAAVQIPGVFADEKFKASATKKTTSIPSYASFFTVKDQTIEFTDTIECDGEVYVLKVKETAASYLDFSIEKLKLAMSGEKVKL